MELVHSMPALLWHLTKSKSHLPDAVLIGVILGGTEGSEPPSFWSGKTDPPLYKYTKSEILLGPLSFQTKVMPLAVLGLVFCHHVSIKLLNKRRPMFHHNF